MATMNVSLPETLKAWVEKRVDSGNYGNASDYMRDLIRRDQERARKIAAMQERVDEGLASGISDQSMDDIATEASRRLRDGEA